MLHGGRGHNYCGWWGKMHFNVVVQNFTLNSNKALYNSTTERVEFQMRPDYKTKHLRWKYFCCRNFRKFVKPNAWNANGLVDSAIQFKGLTKSLLENLYFHQSYFLFLLFQPFFSLPFFTLLDNQPFKINVFSSSRKHSDNTTQCFLLKPWEIFF